VQLRLYQHRTWLKQFCWIIAADMNCNMSQSAVKYIKCREPACQPPLWRVGGGREHSAGSSLFFLNPIALMSQDREERGKRPKITYWGLVSLYRNWPCARPLAKEGRMDVCPWGDAVVSRSVSDHRLIVCVC
jgi:hypothetical protein